MTAPTARGEARQRQVSDYAALSGTVQELGLMRRRHGYYWTKFAVLLAAFAAVVTAVVLLGDSWWQLVLAVVLAVLLTQTAFLGHDAAHRQIFASGRWNAWASLVVANCMVGLSYGWWQHKHTRHHANPNKAGSDPDIELQVLAFTVEQNDRRTSPLGKWFGRRQGWFFFPLLLLEGLNLHVQSLKRAFAAEHFERRGVEIGTLLGRLGAETALVAVVMSPVKALLFLVVRMAVFGLYMGASFAPNHKGMPVVPADVKIDFLRRQVLMSRNISGGWFVTWLMGGLNYQVEHHLFPSMPRPNLRRVQPTVLAFCAEREVRYTQMSLWQSYGVVVRYLNDVGLGVRDTFACPLATQYRA